MSVQLILNGEECVTHVFRTSGDWVIRAQLQWDRSRPQPASKVFQTGDMLQAFRPYDLLRADRWHTAFFSTFSLSLSFFESVPLHALRRAGARNVTIITDLVGYQASLSEAGAADVGRTYDIVPLNVRDGCFHAKIVLVAGEDGLRATIGSGNVTFGGWGRNIECLHYLVPDQSPQAFGDLADFLERLFHEIQGGRIASPSRSLDIAVLIERCRHAARAEGDGRTRVIHSLVRPIIDQLADHANALGGARKLTIVSPFFGNPKAVMRLAQALGCNTVQVCVTGKAPEFFDFEAAEKLGLAASPVRSSAFDAGRLLHAKIIEIVCRKGRILVSGSANATWPALITQNNIEASVLRIVDDTLTFGWAAGDRRLPSDGEGGNPYPDGGACLSARFDGRWIEGRMFGVADPEGAWDARCTSGALQVPLPRIQLGEEGTFRLDVRDIKAFAMTTRSTQLALAREREEVRGWLVFDHLIGAVREHGGLAEAMIRAIAFRDGADDYRTILNFFVANPAAFMSDEIGRSFTKSPADHPSPNATMIDLAALAPVEAAPEQPVVETGSSGSGAFERLLASMRRYVSEAPSPKRARPDARDETSKDGENDLDEHVIPRRCIEEAKAVFVAYVEAFPVDGDDFRRHAVSLLDFLTFVSERSDDPDDLKATSLRSWKVIVRRAHAKSAPDVLDKSFVAVSLARVVEDKTRAGEIHARLQEWCRGDVDSVWLTSAAPIATGIRETRLMETTQAMWDEAAAAVLAAPTPWSTVRQVQLALEGRGSLPALPSSLAEEAAKLQRVAAGTTPPTAILTIRDRRAHPACPRCYRVLLGADLDKLRKFRISQCCGRVLLDPILD